MELTAAAAAAPPSAPVTVPSVPATAAEPLIPFVYFQSKTDSFPKPVRPAPWSRLAARLTRHTVRAEKDGTAWSPVSYHPDTTRLSTSVAEVFALVLDMDHATPAWDRLEAQGLEYAAYSTHSHNRVCDDNPEGGPRWRIILPLAHPVPGPAWRDFYLAARHHLAPAADNACIDPSRLHYWPACPPGATPETRRHAGRLLDPAEVPGLPPELRPSPPPQTPRATPPPPGQRGRPGDDYNRREDWGRLMGGWGWTLVYSRGGEDFWRRPGKASGVSATSDYAGSDCLYVFSSSTPFPVRKGLTKFGAYAEMEHGGDHQAAARALARLGYGDPLPERPAITSAATRNAADQDQQAAPQGPEGEEALEVPKGIAGRLLAARGTLTTMGDHFGAEVTYLAAPYIGLGQLTILAGPPESYKSWLTADLGRAVHVGGLWLGSIPVPRGGVLYLEQERMSNLLYQARLLAAGWGQDLGGLAVVAPCGIDLCHPDWQEAITALVERERPLLVAFNSFKAIFRGRPADSADVAFALGWLGHLAERVRCAIVVIDGDNKGGALGKLRGMEAHADSVQKEYEADTVLHVERDRDPLGRGVGPARVYPGKLRYQGGPEAPPPFVVDLVPTRLGGEKVTSHFPIGDDDFDDFLPAPSERPLDKRTAEPAEGEVAGVRLLWLDEARIDRDAPAIGLKNAVERAYDALPAADSGQTVGITTVAKLAGVEYGSAKNILRRLRDEGRAERASWGQWRRTGPPGPPDPPDPSPAVLLRPLPLPLRDDRGATDA